MPDYVVDVFIPVAIALTADDEAQAGSIAIEQAVAQGIPQRIAQMVDSDDSDFVPSDSELQVEVGEG